MKPSFIIVIIVSLIIFTSCTSSTSSDPVNSTDDNNQIINEAVDQLSDVPGLKTIVISIDSEIVSENYYNGETATLLGSHHLMSVTKSISSILLGIAIDRGYIESEDVTIYQFLSPLSDNVPNEYKNIKIRDLLTMRAGFAWDEITETSEYPKWISSSNQLEYILKKPFVHEIGTRFDYSDGAAHLVSVILTAATGMSTSDFANDFLFHPLGINERDWLKDKQGYCYGGVGLYLSGREMDKIGNLVLNEGRYNGKQIVSKEWISKSTSFQTATNIGAQYGSNYGYFWWMDKISGHNFFYANGYGGQFIFVVKNLNMVISVKRDYNTDPYNAGRHWSTINRIIVENIIGSYSN